MAKKKQNTKLQKLNTFINRDRRIEPMTENDKYLIDTIERFRNHENIQRFTGRTQRPQYI